MNKNVGVGFGVMIKNGNKILLGKRHDDPKKASSELDGAGKWTMPGGKLEFGETFEKGAKREVYEETGLTIKNMKLICINEDIIESAHFVTIGMICEDFSGQLKAMEPDEITEWKWFNVNNPPSPLYLPTKKLLKNYKQKKFYIKEI